MEYFECVFTIETEIEGSTVTDVLISELGKNGFESFAQSDVGLLAYVPVDSFRKAETDNMISNFVLPNATITYTFHLAPEKNWNKEWEKNYYKPLKIGKRCVIRAPFHKEELGFDLSVIINPKMAFGTGYHATTYLMIKNLLNHSFKEQIVLDMGCGTGVLGIVAKMMGADHVVGVDNDEWAYKNAIENVALNNIQMDVRLGDASVLSQFGRFDAILVNITRNILLEDINFYEKALSLGGHLYMSGFLKEDVLMVSQAFREKGFLIDGYEEMDGWAMISTTKIR
ncbi:MAG: 50S ribosomal protein L11 methyltransferase [Massilibacteroides sp.]|nr:50S ribosomal protein L11 methyltransferase [Massilibacteroides sp.]